MVVELIGPVVDDSGALERTLADTLTQAGLDLLPGALDQVAGMAPRHALRTVAEGSGRFELIEDLEDLVRRHAAAVDNWTGRGALREAPGAGAAWQQLAADDSIERAMLTSLPLDLAKRVAGRLGIVVAEHEWLEASDQRGLPHPDHLRAHHAGGHTPVALVRSVGAALGAASAGYRVVAVGSRGGAVMFADEQVATIGEWQAENGGPRTEIGDGDSGR